MHLLTRNKFPRYERDGISSYLLVSGLTYSSQKLSVTLVEMEPGGFQHLHTHEPEQVYSILEGSGLMTVEGEQHLVGAGDSIFIPSWAKHGLQNTGGKMLKSLSACSPSFTREQCLEGWPLGALEEDSQ